MNSRNQIWHMRPKFALIVLIFIFVTISRAAVAQGASADAQIVARISAATVLILSGEGAGRLSSVGTGVIVRPNGIILTAYHAVKDGKEVQVRLHTGDVYDNVVLVGADERRDTAALRIPAASLPTLPLGQGAEAKPGDAAYVVSSSNGLGWTASEGVISALRLADEVPGAGQGYRLLQFTAPVSAGASGGPLVDSRGDLLGIITKGMASGAGFAVPIESVIGLADGTGTTVLGNGAALQMPAGQPSPSSIAAASSNPQDMLRNARTAFIASRSMYFTPESLDKALAGQKGFDALGLVLVKDPRVADLLISIDRPLFTYTFTYSVTDSKTTRILDAGKVTAIDGNAAAGKIAKQLMAELVKMRGLGPSPKAN
jgi:hypothetical protein